MTITTKLKSIGLGISLFLLTLTNVKGQQNTNLINTRLSSEREKFGLTTDDISNYLITDQYTDRNTGLTYAYIQQRHNNVAVYNAISVFLIKDNKVLYFKPGMIDHLAQKVKTTMPSITPEAAIGYALINIGRNEIAPVKLVSSDNNTNTLIYDSPGLSASPLKVQLVYRAMDDGIYLAWDVSIELKNEPHWWNVRIDALTGNYLDKNDWTVSCNFDGPAHNCSTHEHESAAPASPFSPLPPPPPLGEYNVYPFPIEAPSFGGRTNLINPEDLTASPFGWHDDNGIAGNEYTITRGNNVHAYEDANNDNLPGYSPNSATLQFNYPVDLAQAPLVNQDASITNLFYVNNRIHDVLYYAGFTAAAGNFQQNNYGNGGLGNDYVQAEAFDGSGTNNANFGTPADGSRPRMQMYLWTAPNPDRDGSFDNGIVAHEYGHGVSNRLTGGPSNSNCLGNAEQGGEGWSDWLALMLTTEASDATAGGMLTQARGIGTYALNQATNGQGIRRFRYSVDMAINPQTYADLATSGTGPHNKGEIWCDAIWDMSSFLINDLGFNPDPTVATAGNNIAMRLVLEGMKLQPCSPGYLDARDAILNADAILYGNAHRCRIWEAFARRGMGFSATQGSSNSSTDQTAAFDLPPFCLIATQPPVAAFTSNVSTIACAGTVQFTNASTQAFTTAWDFGDGGTSILINPTHQYTSPGTYNVKLVVTNALGSDSVIHPITVTSIFSATVTASPNPVVCGSTVQLNAIGNGSTNATYVLSGITYAPVTGTPIAGPAGDDIVSSFIPIGFNFPFYNTVQTQLKISTNGFISFNSNSGAGCCAGGFIPNNSTTLSNLIAVAWTDLFVGAPNSVDYFNLTAPNRFVIRWNAVAHCCATTPAQVTAQIILYETGEIEMHNTSILTGIDVMTMGIENANGTAATVVPGRNASNFTATNEAWKFTPAINYTYNWLPGNLNGASQTVNPVANTTYTVNVADGSGCVEAFNTPLVTVNPVTVIIGGSASFCAGGSTTLDAGSYSTYSWSTGATTQTITVNSAGTFTVSVTNAGGCSGSGSITTSISTSLTPVILGDLSICSGNTNILDAGVGYAAYSWSTGATTQTIPVSTAGTFTVTVSNGAGCSGTASAITTIDVIPSPTISGNLIYCPGSSSVLSTGLFAGYNWSTGGTTQSISVNTTGTFTVTVTNAEGCSSSASVTTTNYTSPTPVITGATGFCTSSSTILDAGVYTSYAWSTGATTQTITVNSALIFTVTVTDANGCTASNSATTTLFALPNPVISGASTICDGATNILDAGTFAAYNWSTGSSTQTISVTLPGTYTVTVTDGNGCTKSATKTMVSLLAITPAVTLNPNTAVCAGSSVTLTLDSTVTFIQVNPITVPNTLVNATPYPAPLVVSGFPVSGVTVKSVTLNGVSHTFPDDLDILLQSPSGTNVILMSDVGGNPDLVNQNLTFKDGFPALADAGPITSGTYAPTNITSPDTWSAPGPGAFTQAAPALSLFTGDMNGTWNLLIADDLAQDGGSINSWSITFEASNSNITYAWSPTTGLSNTTQIITTATPATTTIYTVTINDGISGCTTSLSATVNINPAPIPSFNGSLSFCPGSSTTLDAGVFASYLWSTSETTQSISVNTAGIFTVTVTDANGCTGSASVTTTVHALPTPAISGNLAFCSGSSTTLDAGSYAGYNWSTGATTQTISVNTEGTFTVTVTDANGCTGSVSTFTTLTSGPSVLINGCSNLQGQTITITENSGTELHNYQVKLMLNTQALVTSGNMNANGNDIRFSKDAGGTVNLPYWIDMPTMNTVTTNIWVKVDTIPASGNKTIYMTYGNPILPPASTIAIFAGPYSSTDSVSSGAAGGVSNSQRGFRFSPNEDILVGNFGKREPNGTTRYVTLFDFNSQAIINQMQVSGPAGLYSYSNVANPIWLTQGTQYLLELYQGSDDGYYFGVSSQVNSRITYYDMRYCNSCTQNTFPTNVLSGYQYGYPDLYFYVRQHATTEPSIATGAMQCNFSFCAGSSTTLDAGSYAGYNWSTGATTQTISVNTAGTFTVTVTNASGCTGSTSVTTTVYAGTSVSITPGGSSEICPNGSVVLSASGGTLSNALVFDGQNDYVQMQDFNIGTSDFTIEAWVNPAVVNGYIVTNRTNEFASSGNWFVVSRDAASKLSLELATNNSIYTAFQGNSVIPSNAWSHIAIVRSGTTILFYVNGVLDGTFNDPIIRNLTTGSNVGRFGGWPNANAEWYNGKLDQVRIWHTARTAGDIQTSMNAIITTNIAGLYDNYTLSESSGTTAADVTATVNNGNLIDGVSREIPSTAPIQTNNLLWSNGATTSSITATAAGTYTVTTTAANGCTATASIDITTALPPAISAGNDTAVCQGSSATLTATGGVSYSWSPAPLPLDIVPTAGLAVGLRKLKSTYNGNAIQLRRSSDNATMDFGFVGNDLDAAAIATWLGNNTGYCTVLYDQSGNGNNVTQVSAGNQPQYLASGINGKPTLAFNTSMFMTNTANFATPYSVVYGARQTGGARQRVLSSTINNWLLGWWGGARQQAHFDGWVTINPGTPAADNNSYIYSATGNGSSSQVYENGTLLFNNSGGLTGPNGIQLNGWLGNLSETTDCEFMDVMAFSSVLSNDHRAYAENSIGAYYNIATTAGSNISQITVTPAVTTTYTVTGTGSNGCTATASVTVTVNTPPVVTCPANVTDTAAAGNCSKTVVYPAATATGNGPVTITYSQSSGTTFDVGNTIVTVTATDVNGCSSTCTFNVIVKDTVAPTIACPASITAYSPIVTFAAPTVSDDCFVSISGSQTFNYTGGMQTFIVPVGADSIEVTAEGAQGGFNGGLGGKTVSKLKVTPGQVLNIYVGGQGGVPGAGYNGGGTGGQGTAYYGGGGGGASDIRIGGTALNNRVIVAGGGGGKGGRSSANSGSGAGGLGGNLSAGSGANQGAACGNSNGGFGALISNGGAGGAAQGCGCSDPGGAGITGIGGNGAVSYSFGGAGGGGAGGGGYFGGGGAGCAGCSSCGNSDYSAGGGGGGNSYVDPSLNGSIVHYQGTRSGDGQVSISYTGGISLAQTTGLPSGSTFPLGTTTNTFVATDASGNSASCSFTVTVIDTIDPVITCPSNIVVTNTPGNCSAVVNYPTPSVTDNMCAPPTSLSGYNYLGSYDGHTYFLSNTNLNWTDAKNAAIAAGGRLASINSAAENAFLVSVIGANAPSIGGFQNPANPNYSEPNGGWEWVDGSPFTYTNWNAGEPNNSGGEDFIQIGSSGWNDIPGSYSNNYIVEMECGLTPTLYAGLPSGSTFPLGTSTVIYVATDGSGNTDTCSFTITVEDNEAPVITTCSAAQTAYANNNCEAAVPDFTAGVVSADLCSPANLLTVTQSPVSGSLAPKGINAITITVTDTSGNSATCATTFTVTDTIAPVINCVAGVTVNTDAGACTAVINLTPPTVSDNCPALVANGVDTFNYTGNMQTFIVPAGITSLHIVTKGAQGGDVTDYGYTGGLGAIMEGDFAVTPGSTLQIIVGGKGNPNATSSGGGGGSGVNAALTNTALIVAGGGAGIDFQEPFYVGRDAVTNINGVAGSQSGGSAGIAGANGGDYTYSGNNTSRGGNGWIIGSTGTFGLNGSSPNTTTSNGTWGLGGGGGSVGAGWCNCGGGGGGYSGGGSGNINSSGGGGGSYNSGTNQINIGGANSGNGLVVISYVVNLPLTITQTGGLPSGSAFPIGTSNVIWTATDASGNTATCTQTVTVVDARPAVVITPSGSTNLCAGGSVTLSAPAGLSPYLWSNGQTTQAILVSTPATYVVTVTTSAGCTNSGSIIVSVSGNLPVNPGVIVGDSTVCGSSTKTYFIAPVPNATSYAWTVGSGASITGGQGTNMITVQFTNATVNASVTVTASNACFSTGVSTRAYAYAAGLPGKPATMNGSFTANCVLLNKVYSCSSVANATSYFWTVPAGVKIISGQGTTSITVNYTPAFNNKGVISVAAVNACGMGNALKRNTTARLSSPVISGPNSMCTGDIKTYTVAAVPGALSYTWTKVAGSTILSGQGTTTVTILWGNVGGLIKCSANNACGGSVNGTYSVSKVCSSRLADSGIDFTEINLYPNPASTSATLQFDALTEGKGLLTVYDIVGQQVLSKPINVLSGDNQFVLDLNAFPKGIYNVRFEYNGMVRNQKLVVQ